MKVLVATEKPFAAAAVNGIREIVEGAGHELALLEKYTEKEQLLAAVADADALIVRSDKVTADVVGAAGQLKIVVRAGAGYDNLDLPSCTERGIVAMNTPGQNSNAVAELAVGLMIYMSRNQFTPGTGCELSGKTIGIQGFGNIGQLVAKKAVGLGMNVIILAPQPGEKHQGWQTVPTIEELYSKSNFVSVNIPATPETKGMIGYNRAWGENKLLFIFCRSEYDLHSLQCVPDNLSAFFRHRPHQVSNGYACRQGLGRSKRHPLRCDI